MSNAVWAILVASSLAVGASVQAQGQQPSPAEPASPAKPASPATQTDQPRPQTPAAQMTKTTISGCIQNAPPAAPSAGGAAASTPAASKFDLANAKMVTPAPVGTAGTAAAAARYRLEGEEKLITPHLNHQVEITGTVSPASGTGATAAPMLKVESVKMIAATCP